MAKKQRNYGKSFVDRVLLSADTTIEIKPDDQQKAAELIVKKITDKWLEDNPQLVSDIYQLASKICLFNLKWGTELDAKDLIEREFKK